MTKAASIRISLLMKMVGLWRAGTCKADTTYIYTGAPFTYFPQGNVCPPVCNFMATLVTSVPLGPDTTTPGPGPYQYPNLPYPIISLSVTDGQTGGVYWNTEYIDITTNSSGVIVSWALDLQAYESMNDLFGINSTFGDTDYNEASYGPPLAGNYTPGTWTETPEPRSLLLVRFGIFVVRAKYYGRQIFSFHTT